jgi:LysM domain
MPIVGPLSNYSGSKNVYPQQNANEQELATALVKKNDSLWRIVKRNYKGTDGQINAAVKAIEKNNNIDPKTGWITPGQRIKLLNGEQLSKIYPELIDVD